VLLIEDSLKGSCVDKADSANLIGSWLLGLIFPEIGAVHTAWGRRLIC